MYNYIHNLCLKCFDMNLSFITRVKRIKMKTEERLMSQFNNSANIKIEIKTKTTTKTRTMQKLFYIIVNFHGSVILPYCIKTKRCMSIMLWVTGRVWPYV